MSELITNAPTNADFRRRLLATVSALALGGSLVAPAIADDSDRPTVWIELGTQAERVDGGQQQFVPPFIANSPRASIWTQSPLEAERLARYAIGGEAKITFAPKDSSWVFTAAARYGRSNGGKSFSQQSNVPTLVPVTGLVTGIPTGMKVPAKIKLSDEAHGKNEESHTILDFMAGKDVGLGLFGGNSTVSLGIRIAQFQSQSNVAMKSRSRMKVHIKYSSFFNVAYYYPHNYDAMATASRSFHGIGPSLSWEGTTPLAGHSDGTQLAVDWGLNGAVLFGRQKVRSHHQTTGRYISQTNISKYNILSQYHHPHDNLRSRGVIVPNVGGFAGFSVNFPDAKVSLGYRADFFFGAMDGGLDTRKTYDRNFYGPYATISIGLGG